MSFATLPAVYNTPTPGNESGVKPTLEGLKRMYTRRPTNSDLSAASLNHTSRDFPLLLHSMDIIFIL